MKKKIFTLLAGLLVALSLVACGGAKSLQEYYERPANKSILDQQMKTLVAQNSSDFSDASVSFSDNTMVYEYVFTQAMPTEQKATFDNYMNQNLAAAVNPMFSQLKAEAGLPADTEVTIVYVYKNPNGSEFSRFEFTK